MVALRTGFGGRRDRNPRPHPRVTSDPPNCPPWCNNHAQVENDDKSVLQLGAFDRLRLDDSDIDWRLARFDDTLDDQNRVGVTLQVEGNANMDADSTVQFAIWLLVRAAEMRVMNNPAVISMPSGPSALAVWQLEPCPRWCTAEHGDDVHPDDRKHWGYERDVSLRHRPALEVHKDTYRQARLSVVPQQHYTAAAPIVTLYTDDDPQHSIQLELYVGEGPQLASALLDVINGVSL